MVPMPKQKKAALAGVAVLVTLALAALVCWASFRPMALESVKKLTVTVSHANGDLFTQELETTARYLYDALEPYDFIEMVEGDEGYYVLGADGEYATSYTGVYWMYNVNGEPAENTVDAQAISDGDVYSFYLTTY